MSANLGMDTEMGMDFSKIMRSPLLQVIPESDRIIIRLHSYGLSSEDIAFVVSSTAEEVETKIETIKQTLNEFEPFL